MKIVSAVVCAAALLAFSGVPAQAEPVKKVRGAELFELDHQDVSPPLRSIKPIPPDWYSELAEKDLHEVKKWPHHHPDAPLGSVADPLASFQNQALARATGKAPSVAAVPGLNFDGVGVPNYAISGAPPDTVGAAGDTQFVQWVNTAFAVFNKSTGALVYGPANGNTLFSGFGGRCETDNSGDPLVAFDKAAHRWVMTQFAVSASPYYQCIAVSTTPDATGTYRRFAYSFGTGFNDYGKIGVWPDAYYITYNMFTNGQAFAGAKVCAYDRVAMLNATATPGAQQCFQLSTTYGGLQAADLDGATAPPAGAPNYVMAFDDVARNGLNLWKFHVDWATPANTTFTGPTKITTAAFTEACAGGTCITQPGTSQQLDSLADRLMFRLAYRNFGDHESLVLNHSVDVSGHSGVRWYEIRSPGTTPVVQQQGTFSPDANHRWMGSAAMDQAGNIMMGYSTSGAVKPSVRFTGRLATDALGTMQPETEMFAGTGVQTGSSLSRWGDYSNLTIDPTDDCTFWFTTEYIKSNGAFNWSTRIGTFKFPGCGGVATPDYLMSASPSTVSVQRGNSGSSTVTVQSLSGFNAAVDLVVTGAPSGVTATPGSNSLTPPANDVATTSLTLAVDAATAAGTYPLTITGTSGTTTHTASVSLTVTLPPPPGQAAYDGTLQAPRCQSIEAQCDSGAALLLGRSGLGPEPGSPNTINSSCSDGGSGTFHVDESNDALKVATNDASAMAAGKPVTVTAKVWAFSTPTSDFLDLYYAANANSPVWVLVATKQPVAAGAQTITFNYTLPAGGLQAVRARFRYTGAAAACGSGNYDDHDDLVFPVGAGVVDTTLPVAAITAPAAGTVSGTVNVTASASDNVGVTKVEFYLDGTLKSTSNGPTYTWSWDTTGTPNGSHTLAAKAYDAASNVGVSADVAVTVSNTGPPPQTAVFEKPGLLAPKCAVVGSSCDSGTLLNGRKALGPERHSPNTIKQSCIDGALGTYHHDPSNDRLKVSTTDGSALAGGKTVTVTATVWTWLPTSDTLDLYYAANANAPVWKLIGSLKPTVGKAANTITTTYTLPTGTLQAIRANYRYKGAGPSVCSAGNYDDHDDLVFATQ
jgi:hypothetical protein